MRVYTQLISYDFPVYEIMRVGLDIRGPIANYTDQIGFRSAFHYAWPLQSRWVSVPAQTSTSIVASTDLQSVRDTRLPT